MRGLQRIVDTRLGLLELGLSRGADLDDGNTAGKLGLALLELLAIEIGAGLLDLRVDGVDALLDIGLLARTIDDGRGVLGHLDALGGTEHVERDVGKRDAELLHDGLAAGDDGDVLEHALAAITEAGSLDGDDVERAANLVEDERGQRLALHVLGNDEERLAGLHDALEQRQDVLDGGDLLVGDEDVGVGKLGLHGLGVVDHVGAQVALVELHALHDVDVDAEGVGILDGDDAVLADLLHGVGDLLANLRIARGDGADVLDLVEGLDLLGVLLDLLDQCVDGLIHARADGDGIGAGGHVLETVANHDIGEKRGGGGAVTGNVVGLDGGLADELRAHVLDLVLELDLLGDGHAVVGDERCTEAALAGDVTALGAKRDLDGIGEFGCAGGKGAARIGTKANVLSSH